jgi:hypothetical protein
MWHNLNGLERLILAAVGILVAMLILQECTTMAVRS